MVVSYLIEAIVSLIFLQSFSTQVRSFSALPCYCGEEVLALILVFSYFAIVNGRHLTGPFGAVVRYSEGRDKILQLLVMGICRPFFWIFLQEGFVHLKQFEGEVHPLTSSEVVKLRKVLGS
jgi:hypothetical protein